MILKDLFHCIPPHFTYLTSPHFAIPCRVVLLGWMDVSLIAEGRAEAAAAGKLLKRHGYTFDVVYTR